MSPSPVAAEAPLRAKTRELRCHLADSSIWNGLALRDGDIVIVT